MYYQIYNQIKQHLKGLQTPIDVQWFNAQYEGTIYKTPVIFVEFPDRLDIEQAVKSSSRASLMVRLHLVTQAITSTDGTVTDATVIEHEKQSTMVADCLQSLSITFNANPARPLSLSGWQHYQKWKGWMVTFIEFSTKVQL